MCWGSWSFCPLYTVLVRSIERQQVIHFAIVTIGDQICYIENCPRLQCLWDANSSQTYSGSTILPYFLHAQRYCFSSFSPFCKEKHVTLIWSLAFLWSIITDSLCKKNKCNLARQQNRTLHQIKSPSLQLCAYSPIECALSKTFCATV